MMVTSIIILNTCTLAMDAYPVINKDMDEAFTYLNYMFTAFFVIEAILKIVGLGLRQFI